VKVRDLAFPASPYALCGLRERIRAFVGPGSRSVRPWRTYPVPRFRATKDPTPGMPPVTITSTVLPDREV